jgi:integrase
MLFKELVELETIDSNPVRDISKKKTVHKMRQELTPKERAIVRKHLSVNYPSFWNFVNIFFHSGSRETELLRLKVSDIDLAGHRFKVLVKKGKQGREQWRPIKDIILPDWQKLVTGAPLSDYLFSVGLKPGPVKIRPDQLNRRWNKHVKIKLGITADLYSLKHSNLDEMAEALQAEKEAVKEASEFAGHTTPVITIKHYLKGGSERKGKAAQGVRNEF